QGSEKSQRGESSEGGNVVGNLRASEIQEHGRSSPVGDADQTCQLRSRQEVSDDCVYLRNAVGERASFCRSETESQHQRFVLREQWLPGTRAGHRLHNWASRAERAQLRAACDSIGRRQGVRG